MGEKQRKEAQGLNFINRATGEVVAPTLWMHVKFFFNQEEKNFGLVIAICIVMGVVLVAFVGYHLRLAKSNQTTNEEFKRG